MDECYCNGFFRMLRCFNVFTHMEMDECFSMLQDRVFKWCNKWFSIVSNISYMCCSIMFLMFHTINWAVSPHEIWCCNSYEDTVGIEARCEMGARHGRGRGLAVWTGTWPLTPNRMARSYVRIQPRARRPNASLFIYPQWYCCVILCSKSNRQV